jgi:hypothetical protein
MEQFLYRKLVSFNRSTEVVDLPRYVEFSASFFGHWVNENPVMAARVSAVRAETVSPDANSNALPVRAIPTPIKWR